MTLAFRTVVSSSFLFSISYFSYFLTPLVIFLSPSLSILLSIFISKLKWLLSPPRCSYPKNFKIYKPQSNGKTGTEFNSREKMQVQIKSQRFSLYLKNSQWVLYILSYTCNTRMQTHTHTHHSPSLWFQGMDVYYLFITGRTFFPP